MFRLGTTRQGKNNMHWVVRWSCQDPPKRESKIFIERWNAHVKNKIKGQKKSSRKGIDRGDKRSCWERLEREGEIYSSRGQTFMPGRPKRIGTYIHREAKCSWQERPKREGGIFIEGTNVLPKNDPKGKENIIREAKCSSQERPEREGNIFIRRPNLHAENDRKGKEKYSSRGQMFMQRTNQKIIHSIIQ